MRAVLLVLLVAVGCQTTPREDDYTFGEFLGVSEGSGQHWRAALKPRTRNIAALSLGAASALLQIDDTDERWQEEIAHQDWFPGSSGEVSDFGAAFLPGLGLVAPLVFAPRGDEGVERWRYCATAAYAIALNGGLVVAVKNLSKRERPDGGSRSSFYSGHTTFAFTGAQLLQRYYGPKAGVPAYVLAAAVAWNRVEGDRHFPADVLMGAAMGIFVTDLIYEKNFGPDGLYSAPEAQLVPILTDAERGLALRWSW